MSPDEAEHNRLRVENAALLQTVQKFADLRVDRMSADQIMVHIARAREQLRLAVRQKKPLREPPDAIERQIVYIQNVLKQLGEPYSPITIRCLSHRLYETWVEGCEQSIGYAEGVTAKDAIVRLYSLVQVWARDQRAVR